MARFEFDQVPHGFFDKVVRERSFRTLLLRANELEEVRSVLAEAYPDIGDEAAGQVWKMVLAASANPNLLEHLDADDRAIAT